MKKVKYIKQEVFNGATIMVKHGSGTGVYENNPYKDYKTAPYIKDQKGNTLNCLARLSFVRSERNEEETVKEHYIRDKKFFDEMLKAMCNRFNEYDIYTLPLITKTSKMVVIN